VAKANIKAVANRNSKMGYFFIFSSSKMREASPGMKPPFGDLCQAAFLKDFRNDTADIL
jgi:hypothetical protein